jgi:hypothetical protein
MKYPYLLVVLSQDDMITLSLKVKLTLSDEEMHILSMRHLDHLLYEEIPIG